MDQFHKGFTVEQVKVFLQGAIGKEEVEEVLQVNKTCSFESSRLSIQRATGILPPNMNCVFVNTNHHAHHHTSPKDRVIHIRVPASD